jgi:hypothetical protein
MKMDAPPKPKTEPIKVTIANQDLQIRNLVDRVAALSSENRVFREKDQDFERERQSRKAAIDILEKCQAHLARQQCIFEGYRMAIADIVEGSDANHSKISTDAPSRETTDGLRDILRSRSGA